MRHASDEVSDRMTPSRAIHISGYDRQGHDFYATPDWVTAALLRNVTFRSGIWEPCCGDGSIARVLERAGYGVVASDLQDRGYGSPGVDVLAQSTPPSGCGALVTNPPYGDGRAARPGRRASPMALLDFVRHVLRVIEPGDGQAALLVRLQWIPGKRAAALLQSGPLDAIIMLTERIQWFDHGEATKRGQHNHAWIVFDYLRPIGRAPRLLFAGPEEDRPARRCVVCGQVLPPTVRRAETCSSRCRERLRSSQRSDRPDPPDQMRLEL